MIEVSAHEFAAGIAYVPRRRRKRDQRRDQAERDWFVTSFIIDRPKGG